MKCRALEFYSGIGGWSTALQHLNNKNPHFEVQVVAAYDVNPAANQTYEHNYRLKPLTKSIEHLNAKDISKFEADIWFLSPPCQPFTRNNTTDCRDTNDPRTNSFLHLLNLLDNIHRLPSYLFIENVVGFEKSAVCELFLQIMKNKNYQTFQFHLSPLQFGIPNDRPRYYCIAILNLPSLNLVEVSTTIFSDLNHLSSVLQKQHQQQNELADIARPYDISPTEESSTVKAAVDSTYSSCTSSTSTVSSLSRYLQPTLTAEEWQTVLLPSKTLYSKSSWCLDIQTARSHYSACFTKSYSRFIRGTGSVLLDWFPAADDLSVGSSSSLLLTESRSNAIAVNSDHPDERKVSNESHFIHDLEELLRWNQCKVDDIVTVGQSSAAVVMDEINIKINLQESEVIDNNIIHGEGVSSIQTNSNHFHSTSKMTGCATEDHWWDRLTVRATKPICLRYFTSRELLNLFGFFETFEFPAMISTGKQYELIGNSVNTIVVAALLEYGLVMLPKIVESINLIDAKIRK
jgi:tRNA (cytosine38-C5)-methyltransferase